LSSELRSLFPPVRLLVPAEDLPSVRVECRLALVAPGEVTLKTSSSFENRLLVRFISKAPRISGVARSFVKHLQANCVSALIVDPDVPITVRKVEYSA
jgi:hypothetical protein